ncbi:MAG: CcmD family protein [Actinomycetota bacterium]
MLIALARTAAQIEQTKLIYLGVGFSFVWIAIAFYLFSIIRRQSDLQARVDKLKNEPPWPK